jgi:hypothetical protein
MSEVPMHFYFAHGALRCEAVYYPALQGTPEKRSWAGANNRLQFAVAWNPAVASERITGGSSLALLPGDQLRLALPEGRPFKPIHFYLENPGGESTLAIRYRAASGAEGRTRLVLPAGWAGWLPLGAEERGTVTELHLRLVDGERVRVRGLRLGSGGPYHWPWDQQVTLEHLPGDPQVEPRLIQFETGLLFPDLGFPVRILADGGDTVLAEIIPQGD